MFREQNGALLCRIRHEQIRIEAWGKNALRFRSTENAAFDGNDWALDEPVAHCGEVWIAPDGSYATVKNGKISVRVTAFGAVTYYSEGKKILNEFYRQFNVDTPHSPSQKLMAREYKAIAGDEYAACLQFESDDAERIYGMGQYQDGYFDLKGCTLELAQRNTQVSVPFYISSLGYGFLWNNPCAGNVVFGKNVTKWQANVTEGLDYWITADGTAKDILHNFTECVGTSSLMPEDVLGLWQCKLRYRTQDEVLSVAREYVRRGVKIDVIVIDFFHWPYQGDWRFDPTYWPDPKAMVAELKSYGIRCMVSIWPTVDKRSENFAELMENGWGIKTERGSAQCFDFLGDCVIYDATNPDARAFIWDKCKRNYYDDGVDLFWLDEAEPEFCAYHPEHYRYYIGHDAKVGNIYPRMHAQAFYDGLKREGRNDICNLLRSAWVGSQKYGTVVWSGDIYGNFASLRDQYYAGLNMAMAGIAWWTTDIGGFFVDVKNPAYRELLLRWFEYAVFCPILRMHGDKGPSDIPRLDDRDFGGGFCHTGLSNELWSFGEDVFEILKGYVTLREELKPYIMRLNHEANASGDPLMRPMFYEFPDDGVCAGLSDQYMFGDSYLVAPVLQQGQTKKDVYLPCGRWQNIFTNEVYEGGRYIVADAPVEIIPVYKKIL